MKILLVLPVLVLPIITFTITQSLQKTVEEDVIEPALAKVIEMPLSDYERMMQEINNWERPDGPIKVALQAGHWKAHEAPDEFENLSKNTGASAGGIREVDVNLLLAKAVKPLLEEQGIEVDILPATIPPNYWADIFISIHGDGSTNTSASGYKAATSWRDLTGKGDTLTSILEQEYGKATGLKLDPNITRNMRGYYAFNWRRYEHALHPMTIGVILETGFITNASDRYLLTQESEKSIAGIYNGLLSYLKQSELASLLPRQDT